MRRPNGRRFARRFAAKQRLASPALTTCPVCCKPLGINIVPGRIIGGWKCSNCDGTGKVPELYSVGMLDAR